MRKCKVVLLAQMVYQLYNTSNKRRRELMNKVKDSNQNIAKAVLKIRQDNKLSQEQFAEMVGVTRQAVSRWEMGVSQTKRY